MSPEVEKYLERVYAKSFGEELEYHEFLSLYDHHGNDVTTIDRLVTMPGIMEIYGEAGSHKTHLLYQLSYYYIQNFGRNVLFIGSEGDFRTERFFQLCCNDYAVGCKVALLHILDSGSLLHFLAYFAVNFIRKYDVGFLVIDSLAALLRIVDTAERKIQMTEFEQQLRNLIARCGVTVFLSNQVTTRLKFSYNKADNGHQYCPALGHIWSNIVDGRFLMIKNYSDNFQCCCIRAGALSPGVIF